GDLSRPHSACLVLRWPSTRADGGRGPRLGLHDHCRPPNDDRLCPLAARPLLAPVRRVVAPRCGRVGTGEHAMGFPALPGVAPITWGWFSGLRAALDRERSVPAPPSPSSQSS